MDFITDLVKEKGVTDIIYDYKYQLETQEKYKRCLEEIKRTDYFITHGMYYGPTSLRFNYNLLDNVIYRKRYYSINVFNSTENYSFNNPVNYLRVSRGLAHGEGSPELVISSGFIFERKEVINNELRQIYSFTQSELILDHL